MSKIRVIVVRIAQAPEVTEIEHTVKVMQGIVGGHFTVVRLDAQTDLFCDDEALLKNTRANRFVERRLPIHGDFFIVGHDGEGETVSLTDEQVTRWLARANDWPVAIYPDTIPPENMGLN